MNYVTISVENVKIIFGDQSFTLPFILNSWIFIPITTIVIYLNDEVEHIYKNTPIYPSSLSKPYQIGSVSSSFFI